MRYVADVAARLPQDVYSTSKGFFRMIWRTCKGHALTLQLRTVYLYVFPPARRRPTCSHSVHVSPSPHLTAYWKFEILYTPKTDFRALVSGQGDV